MPRKTNRLIKPHCHRCKKLTDHLQLRLDPPKPILETALQGGFALISDEPGREIVFGAAVIAPPTTPRPVTAATLLDQSAPGLARAIMNFRIEQIDPAHCRLITETRVHATDAATARKFSWYWRLIYPGSWIIRWTWLNAIRDRAISVR